MPRTSLFVVILLLAGCGAAPPSAPTRTSAAPPSVPARTSAAPSSAPPSARVRQASARPDDIDRDGFSDLAFQVRIADRERLVILYGSRRGLDPARRTVLSRFVPWIIDGGLHADLDGDGFGDVLAFGAPEGRDEPMVPGVFWGGRAGIAADALPTPIVPPVTAGAGAHRATTGDFDGDGTADVAMALPPEIAPDLGTSPSPSGPGASPSGGRGAGPGLALLFGPFDRAGRPARRVVRASPTGQEFWRMTADRIGAWPGGLVAFEGDDGEQRSGWLLAGRRGGPAERARELTPGMAAAFGDFDGDGVRDLAAGDDGSRNNEPGEETEPPEVDRTLTVYYGDGRERRFKGANGRATAADLNGDGHDDLVFGRADGDSPPRVHWGGPDGLGPGQPLPGASGTPLTSGDYDGDGDGDVVLIDEGKIQVTDGKRIVASFDAS
ncbi:FG-GAP repeat domain-containing protein [Nonomuraea sp. NPDC050394]|uniref:FG-GAP repeat domain-containing protein n=1 Tax=Nonomuraea sp. NPDC050394 TaxID=3364363 RepID=UPI0037B4F486